MREAEDVILRQIRERGEEEERIRTRRQESIAELINSLVWFSVKRLHETGYPSDPPDIQVVRWIDEDRVGWVVCNNMFMTSDGTLLKSSPAKQGGVTYNRVDTSSGMDYMLTGIVRGLMSISLLGAGNPTVFPQGYPVPLIEELTGMRLVKREVSRWKRFKAWLNYEEVG